MYLAGGALFVAYLAAANMPSQDGERTQDRERLTPAADSPTLADEVRSQATRLHARLADAPAPENTTRNPFAFGVVARAARTPQPDVHAEVPEAAPMPVAAPMPMLTLMGIAEEYVIGGVRRTAVISMPGGGGDADPIFMVTEGDPVGDRYKVTKIGADAVELEDVVTKAYRRLALR